MPELFKPHCSDHTANAQRNLMGRTHFVDPDTLRFHKSRVLSSHIVDRGLLFAVVTSDALDWDNTKRGYRYAIFDLFGTCLGRPDLQNAYKRKEQATKAMWAELNSIDAHGHTLKAIEEARRNYEKELEWTAQAVNALQKNAA